MTFYSPLRYPGGKNKLAKFLAKICVDNEISGHYVEPYAGGASVAFFLLMEKYVKQITINDKDLAIYAFWYSVLYDTKNLIKKIRETEITIENWRIQKNIQKQKEDASLLDLGFSTFFLNRTNISGIINAGPIGGINQVGKYKLSCRYNKEELIKRIQLIAKYKKHITLENLDALDLIKKIKKTKNTIFYFDPPYYLKGQSLYLNAYSNGDHKKVADEIRKIRNVKWIVSYDNTPEITELYDGFNKIEYSFKHTAYRAKEGLEVLFFSNNLINVDSKTNPVLTKI
ncbi:MAG: DNA adenine methylase [candidate division SR1 bacterium]|nr:DNA adenine methylase [candidate division SR1 bacterium]